MKRYYINILLLSCLFITNIYTSPNDLYDGFDLHNRIYLPCNVYEIFNKFKIIPIQKARSAIIELTEMISEISGRIDELLEYQLKTQIYGEKSIIAEVENLSAFLIKLKKRRILFEYDLEKLEAELKKR